MNSKFQIVWFKKDLRAYSHKPLEMAMQNGPTIGVYFIEPSWIDSPEFDPCHFEFLKDSLLDLKNDLEKLNVPLLVIASDLPMGFSQLKFPIDKIWSHQETGVWWTFQRDLQVKEWCKIKSILWTEYPQFGVQRSLKNRDQWEFFRNKILQENRIDLSPQKKININSSKYEFQIHKSEKKFAIKGGRKEGLKNLESFLSDRSLYYFESLSSPVTAFDYCSRLSSYITWGNLSLKEIFDSLDLRKKQVASYPNSKVWFKNLYQFENRLWWHCHFIQKLESEPQIEFQNVNQKFNGLRENQFNEQYFEAWKKGETGFPMIDACMRALKLHGWINFRMRAMLVSFSSYQLWLHWRKPAQFLAKQFIDFEPGIHFSQMQMQSGVTGINAIRVYSPEKQALDRDPTGEFIKTYCPELSHLPTADLIAPYNMPPLLQESYNFKLGRDYPNPIVDPKSSYQNAKLKIFNWLKKSEVIQEAKKVYIKHGSRKNKNFRVQKRPIQVSKE